MKAYCKDHIGFVRLKNQDVVEIKNFSDGVLVVLCDGMGGMPRGEEASNLAVTAFIEHFSTFYNDTYNDYKLTNLLRESVGAANTAVYLASDSDPENYGMGTTLVACFANEEYFYIVNVGDSRAYYLNSRSTEFEQITHDHTVVREKYERGEITKEEISTHKLRHVLSKAVGVDGHIIPDLYKIKYEPYIKILLCSDGLHGTGRDSEIRRIMLENDNDSEKCVVELVDYALFVLDGPDNISVAIINGEQAGNARRNLQS
jgi:protein phosphatase